MSERPWLSLLTDQAPEKTVVETRNERTPKAAPARLERWGRFWWLPDHSEMVTYQPTHWRAI